MSLSRWHGRRRGLFKLYLYPSDCILQTTWTLMGRRYILRVVRRRRSAFMGTTTCDIYGACRVGQRSVDLHISLTCLLKCLTRSGCLSIEEGFGLQHVLWPWSIVTISDPYCGWWTYAISAWNKLWKPRQCFRL